MATRTSGVPYVVLLGDVGTGKSTLVEKLTGETGRSSDHDESFTVNSECFATPDGGLLICDTPGANSMADTFQHNLHIAQAMNLEPVWKVLVTVCAGKRIDNIVSEVGEYADRFVNLDNDLLGVIVTHMDEVNWTEQACTSKLTQHLGIRDVVYSRLDLSGPRLQASILQICRRPHPMNVDHANFLKLFKIGDYDRGIVRSIKKEVDDFKDLRTQFYDKRTAFGSNDMKDATFEFLALLERRISEAKARVTDTHNFTFCEGNTANEVGHIAAMANQMMVVLRELKTEAIGYQRGHGVDLLRRCPHCRQVWAKFEGCNGATTCGARPSAQLDGPGTFGTFTFTWEGASLNIRKTGQRQVTAMKARAEGNGGGCGRSIQWSAMAPVTVPAEFSEVLTVGSVEHVEVMPEVPLTAQANWRRTFDTVAENISIERHPARRQ